MTRLRGLCLLLMFLLACSSESAEEQSSLTFKAATGMLTVLSNGPHDVALHPERDDITFFGPANANETDLYLEFMMRSSDGRFWLQLNIFDVQKTGQFIDFRPGEGDGRITVLVGEICDGGMGKLLDDACAWYSTDFFSAGCVVNIAEISHEAMRGTVECRSLGSNCTPDSNGDRDSSGVCLDRLRRPLVGFSAGFDLEQPVDALSRASRSPRSLLR